jgi:membrane protein YqaA with SNARE-associated domain
MNWLSISAETGLWGFVLSAFLGATLLPGGSEAVLFALLKWHPDALWPALCLGSLANTAGGMTSWACGRWLRRWQSPERLQRLGAVQRWGAPVLLLSWTPLLGDALCVAAGWLRLSAWQCALFMGIGKFFRYWLVTQGALW